MSLVANWLAAESSRLANLPRLEDALLGESPSRYAVYRLRYVFVRALLRTILRMVELALFASAVPFDLLGGVLVVRSCMLVSEGFWWGALEPLRNDVRQLCADGRTGQASLRIRQWLVLVLGLGGLGIAATSVWVWLGGDAHHRFNVIDAYLLGSALRWAADLWSTTYHAGVYGARRVYRPLWSLVLTDVADVGVLAASFWWLGAWGLGVSLGLVGLLRLSLSWSFTRRVYNQLKIDLGGPHAWLGAWNKASWTPRVSLAFGFGNLVAEVDALLVVGLVAAPGEPEGALVLAALFHVLAPLQSAASTWPRLFYFDFKRLQVWGSPLLLRRFETFLRRAARWVPLPIGVVTFAILAAFWRGPYIALGLELWALTAVRSGVSLVHVRAYALGDHRFLRRLLVGMVGAAAVTPFAAQLGPEIALGLVVTLAAVALLVVGRSQRPLQSRPPRGLLGPTAWLRHLLDQARPTYVGLARVDRKLASVGRLARAWRETLPAAVFGRLSHDTVVWFASERPDERLLVTRGAGAVRELQVGQVVDSGRQAFERGVASATWQRHFAVAGGLQAAPPDAESSDNLPSLEQRLRAVHPGLAVVRLGAAQLLPELDTAAQRELRQLILDAARGHTGFRVLASHDVAILAPNGAPLALVAGPIAARPTNLTWRAESTRIMERAELALTLAYTPTLG